MRTRSPFPGMDPYLEDGEVWQDFNSALAVEIRNVLNRQIGPKYYAAVETHTVSQDVFISLPHAIYPDVGVYQKPSAPDQHPVSTLAAPAAPLQRVAVLGEETRIRSVQVYLTKTAELVTALEILSPHNKRGAGLEEYRKKRETLLKSQAHLVEFDLLRGGTRPGLELHSPPLDCDYVLVVNRARSERIRVSEIWPLALNEPFPVFPIPLREPDPDVILNLNEIFHAIYTDSGYGWRIDYTQPIPPPELRPAMVEWMRTQFSLAEQ